VWASVWSQNQTIARAAIAASSMWTANAATISPSTDSADRRLHASVANLQTMLHRAQEAPSTERVLRRLFANEERFTVHGALPFHEAFSDEGAANHMRMASSQGAPGIQIFVYGRNAGQFRAGFPARQTIEASQAIARRHGLDSARTIFVKQAAKA